MLNSFLRDNGLIRLSLLQMENRYARETDPDQRMEFARSLLQHYRQTMLNPKDREVLPRLIKNTDSILRDFSQLDSSGLQLAKSHASFLVTENMFFQWWQNSAKLDSASLLTERLQSLQNDILRQQRLLDELRKDLVAALPLIQEVNSLEQKRLTEVDSQLAHLNFLSGWSRYFEAVAQPNPKKQLLDKAHNDFFRSLHLEPGTSLDKVQSKWLELEGSFARKAVLGLGLIYAAKRETTSSQFCFAKLKQLDSEFEKDFWQLNAIAFARDWELLNELVLQQNLNSASINEKRQYYKALTFAGIVAESFSSNSESLKLAKQLQRGGFLGMLRAFDFDSIVAVTKAHSFNFDSTNSEDIWIKGVILLQQAESQPGLFQSASNTLQQALEDSKLAESDSARIRYLVAVAEFRSQNADSALEFLSDDITQSSDPLLAESALWLKARIMVARARRSAGLIPSALVVLNQLDSQFPNSKFKKQTQFEKLLLESKLLRPLQANQLLYKVRSESDYYPEAMAEVTSNLFKIWKSASKSLSSNEPKAFDGLQKSALGVINDNRSTQQKKIAAIFYLIDAKLARNEEQNEFKKLFEWLESIASDQQVLKSEVVEKIEYYKFSFARRFNDLDTALQTGNWLANNASLKQHRISALGYLVQQADSNKTPVEDKILLYKRLVAELGSDEKTLQSSRNARVAAHRLVEILMQAEQIDAAAKTNEKLLSAFPRRREYVVNAGRIQTRLGHNEKAIEYWRKIASGTSPGKPLWIEAKYNIAKIVALSDKQKARQIAEQTLNLTDEIPDAWRLKISELVKQLDEISSVQ